MKNPMDFSTTKEKIDNKLYNNVMEYKADVKLICVNAMNYNHPETIYYKVHDLIKWISMVLVKFA